MAERLTALDDLGEEFARIARNAEAEQPRRSSRHRIIVVLVVLSVLAVAAVAVAASGVLSGAPVKNPPGVKISPTRGEGTVTGATLLPLRVADPAGGLPWGLRLVHTTRGYACLQLGRVNGSQIGVLGQDGSSPMTADFTRWRRTSGSDHLVRSARRRRPAVSLQRYQRNCQHRASPLVRAASFGESLPTSPSTSGRRYHHSARLAMCGSCTSASSAQRSRTSRISAAKGEP